MLKSMLKRLLPHSFYTLVARRLRGVRWGSFRRVTPISVVFGLDRGQPIDRYYIESFLHAHSGDIQGRVLEVGDAEYTRRFGGAKVVWSDVLHAVPGNPEATLIGDLSTGAGIPESVFDCLVLTQVFLVIYNIQEAVQQSYRALKPGGVLLATVPGISQISRYDMERWGDYWRFTDAAARRLFGDVFGAENVTVEVYGNVLTACAFLHGLATHELTARELDFNDSNYQVTIGIRAIKPK